MQNQHFHEYRMFKMHCTMQNAQFRLQCVHCLWVGVNQCFWLLIWDWWMFHVSWTAFSTLNAKCRMHNSECCVHCLWVRVDQCWMYNADAVCYVLWECSMYIIFMRMQCVSYLWYGVHQLRMQHVHHFQENTVCFWFLIWGSSIENAACTSFSWECSVYWQCRTHNAVGWSIWR